MPLPLYIIYTVQLRLTKQRYGGGGYDEVGVERGRVRDDLK